MPGSITSVMGALLKFVTNRYDSQFRYNFVTIRYYFDPFHPTKFHPCFFSITIY